MHTKAGVTQDWPGTHTHCTVVTPLTIIVTVHAEPQRCICRAAVWAAASRAAASRARGRRRRGRRRRGVEGGGDKGSSGATRAAAICMRAAGRRGWQRRGPRAAATSAATWRRATPATLTRAVAKATPRGLQVRSSSTSCAPIQPRTAGRAEICAALRGGRAARPDNTAKVSAVTKSSGPGELDEPFVQLSTAATESKATSLECSRVGSEVATAHARRTGKRETSLPLTSSGI